MLGRHPEEDDAWIIKVFAGVFGLVGLLIIWSWFQQMMMSRTPHTQVEVSARPFLKGHSCKVALVQPGPAHLRSLRANLVCVQRDVTWRKPTGGSNTDKYKQVAEKIVSTETLVEALHLRVLSGDTWHEVREFTIPSDGPSSKTTPEQVILWKIEVWGEGGFFGSFLHVHEIVVLSESEALALAAAESEADEATSAD